MGVEAENQRDNGGEDNVIKFSVFKGGKSRKINNNEPGYIDMVVEKIFEEKDSLIKEIIKRRGT